jgi:heme-degrading monooxygenase HmoA
MPRIAFMTMGILQASTSVPLVQGYLSRIEANFNAAEGSRGYIDHSRYLPELDDYDWGGLQIPVMFQSNELKDRRLMTLSLWRDLESVMAFAYTGLHAEALRYRREWFIRGVFPNYVAWWVGDNETPTWREACKRYENLYYNGSTTEAFDFRQPFCSDGKAVRVERDILSRRTSIE